MDGMGWDGAECVDVQMGHQTSDSIGHNYIGHNYKGHNYICHDALNRLPRGAHLAIPELDLVEHTVAVEPMVSAFRP